MYVRCVTNSDSWENWLEVKERLAIEIKNIVEKDNTYVAFHSQSSEDQKT